jgi:hypothetical protein
MRLEAAAHDRNGTSGTTRREGRSGR